MRPTHLETRYKHDLSPRQREVLELIARGKTNAEIADGLGISLDGAKYHVREILAKLGVDSREEAATEWRRMRSPLGRLRHLILAGLGSVPRSWPVLAAIGVGAAVAAGGAAITIIAPWDGGGGGDPIPGQVVATATPTPVPTPTPRPTIPQPPGPDVTPEPGSTPDTTQPWWYVPWVNAERDKPLFDGTLAGIRIANGASGAAYVCDGEVLLSDKLSDAAGSPVDVTLPSVPPGIVLSTRLAFPDGVLLCDGTPFSAGVSYSLNIDKEWSPWGGSVFIYRHLGEPVASVAIPAWRWEEREIAGLTVAVAHPIIDELGLRESAIVAYRDGVVTVIQADGVPFAKLLEIGEAMLGQ